MTMYQLHKNAHSFLLKFQEQYNLEFHKSFIFNLHQIPTLSQAQNLQSWFTFCHLWIGYQVLDLNELLYEHACTSTHSLFAQRNTALQAHEVIFIIVKFHSRFDSRITQVRCIHCHGLQRNAQSQQCVCAEVTYESWSRIIAKS